MNNLDKTYTDLLQDILDNGVEKKDRTGTGTLSVFGRQIRHNMQDGFPLLTTKKMAWKTMVTELLWFLRGDTNIKYLVDNGCHIWVGDSFSNYLKEQEKAYKIEYDELSSNGLFEIDLDWQNFSQEEFIAQIKTDDEFAKRWGELGPIYGKQWRSWIHHFPKTYPEVSQYEQYIGVKTIDQIANLISELKTNPDSRRLMVSAWNVGELDQMVLPPCHYGFQVYTRELSLEERKKYAPIKGIKHIDGSHAYDSYDWEKIPQRAISLMFNMRSIDTFLGLPFNIASYGLLLEIIAKAVNMVPDELIGNLGDVHLYSNHIEQAKEQIGRELSLEERVDIFNKKKESGNIVVPEFKSIGDMNAWTNKLLDEVIPKRTREPYTLPTLNINTEFWPYEGGECGVGPLDAIAVFNSFKNDDFCRCLLEEDIQLSNYQSHPKIDAPLSN